MARALLSLLGLAAILLGTLAAIRLVLGVLARRRVAREAAAARLAARWGGVVRRDVFVGSPTVEAPSPGGGVRTVELIMGDESAPEGTHLSLRGRDRGGRRFRHEVSGAHGEPATEPAVEAAVAREADAALAALHAAVGGGFTVVLEPAGGGWLGIGEGLHVLVDARMIFDEDDGVERLSRILEAMERLAASPEPPAPPPLRRGNRA